ncbi:hypothetical protein WN55_02542 [Dufourea novaeangliae]|uniref:Uncharacterized protein n=1 Tax=Dufourea novaeangliae TaxID=178035 RepID=A0A154PHN3_DUFNO|nr:hypothetical protein WN55_02542 [Dufourea novaeangliae]
MRSQSACDCYCKIGESTARQRNGAQSDRSRVRLVTSKTSISRTDAIRSAKNVPFTPANSVQEDQPGTKGFSVTVSVSPVLSPETSAALEDVERLVKDAQIQINAISMAGSFNRPQTPLNAYPEEISLDDENDQLLYIRERVADKFQEVNGWINQPDPNSQTIAHERGIQVKLKRSTDFSASRFKTSVERHKEFSHYGRTVIQDPGISSVIPLGKEKGSKEPNGMPCRELERNTRMTTFSVQNCPPVSIKGELTSQNLENIRISPDPSFVQENVNVGTYIVSRDPWIEDRPSVRKKFVRIPGKNEVPKGRRRSTPVKQKEKRTSNETDGSVSSTLSSVSKVKSAEASKVSKVENNEKCGDSVKIADENVEILKSTGLQDVAVGTDEQKLEDREIQVEIDLVPRNTDDQVSQGQVTGQGALGKSDQKQVRFKEEILERIEGDVRDQRSTVESKNEGECQEIVKETVEIFIESENEQDSKENLRRFVGPSTSRRLDLFRDCSSFCEPNGTIQRKNKHIKNEKREDEHCKIVDEQFADLLRKYCSENESAAENGGHLVSSSVDSSAACSDDSGDLDDLYCPSIDRLDNVLLAYNKAIDDASRTTRTIEKYLLRPELEEFLTNHVTTESSESFKMAALNRREPGITKPDSLKYLHDKQKVELMNSTKDRQPTRNKQSNKEHKCRKPQPKITEPTSLKKARCNKADNQSRKMSALSKNPRRAPLQTDSTVAKRFSVGNSRMLSTEIEDSNRFRATDDSSSLASSMNPSSTENNTEAISKISLDNFPELSADRRTNMASIQDDGTQMDNFDCTAFRDVPFLDVVKEGSMDRTRITERLIHRVLKEETRAIEDGIKNALGVDRIVPLLLKGLLGNIRNGNSPQNLELLITENGSVNNVASNVDAIETARVTDNEEKQQSRSVLRADTFRNNGKAIETNGETDGNKNPKIDPVDDVQSESSCTKRTASRSNHENLTIDEVSKIHSDVESLNDISYGSGNSDLNRDIDNSGENLECSKRKGNDVATTRKVLSIVNEKMEDEDKSGNDQRNSVSVNTDENVGAVDKSSGKNEDTGSTQRKEALNVLVPCKLTSEAKNKKSVGSDLDQNNVPVEFNDNVGRNSSCDSLHDCVSIQSSPRHLPKESKMAEPFRGTDTNERVPETNNTIDGISNGVTGRRGAYCGTFAKEKFLSDLYDDIREQLLRSTLDTNRSSAIEQNFRSSRSVPATESNKTETSSNTSRSEGELCVPSSSSYSLGEVKVLGTEECDSSITVFITKEMLASWNESSKVSITVPTM